LALLQRVPAKQRAVLLLRDVVGWSADEVAAALDMSVSSVNSALHRARELTAMERPALAVEPSPELVQQYVRSWETHDLDALVALLHDDVALAMPPWATWFSGRAAVADFLRGEQLAKFRARTVRITLTRANGQLALAFYADEQPHSIQIPRFVDGRVVEMLQLIGPDQLRGFARP
jgi:RNA polymerase sigma-70 factor (ECF subfamily)